MGFAPGLELHVLFWVHNIHYMHIKKIVFLSTCRPPYFPLGCCLQGWPLSIICFHPTRSSAFSPPTPTSFTSSFAASIRLLPALPFVLLSCSSNSASFGQYLHYLSISVWPLHLTSNISTSLRWSYSWSYVFWSLPNLNISTFNIFTSRLPPFCTHADWCRSFTHTMYIIRVMRAVYEKKQVAIFFTDRNCDANVNVCQHWFNRLWV